MDWTDWTRIFDLGRLTGLTATAVLFATTLSPVAVDPARAQGQTGPLIPASSKVYALLPVDQAKLNAEEELFIASIAKIYADDEFFVAISDEFQQLGERYKPESAPERAPIHLALVQIERFRSVFRGELAAISMPEKRAWVPAKGWVNGIESAFRSYGYVFIELNGKQFHPVKPPIVTQDLVSTPAFATIATAPTTGPRHMKWVAPQYQHLNTRGELLPILRRHPTLSGHEAGRRVRDRRKIGARHRVGAGPSHCRATRDIAPCRCPPDPSRHLRTAGFAQLAAEAGSIRVERLGHHEGLP